MQVMRKLRCGRRAPRKAVDLRCPVRPKGGRARRLRMTELSTHGAWLRTSKPLAEGTLVEVGLAIADEPERWLRGEVMWTTSGTKDAGMALEWLDVDAPARAWLTRAAAGLPEIDGKPSDFEYADAV